MRLEFDNRTMRVENDEGRRWELSNVEKPRLSFAYDALSVTRSHAVRRVGGKVEPLTKREIDEVSAFVARQVPPPPQRQIAADLKLYAHGLINAVVAERGYDTVLDVQIAGRADSTNMRASEARQILAFVDTVWNAYHGLVSQIEATPAEELEPFNDYANMMPMMPKPEYFRGNGRAKPGARAAVEADGRAALHTAADKHGDAAGATLKSAREPGESAAASNADVDAHPPGRPVALFEGAPERADFSTIVDRALVFDDVLPAAQLLLFEEWAMCSPHWMLSNSSHDEHGHAKHRIWGASFIEGWRRKGWAGLPPVLFSVIVTLFQRLNVTITQPEYIGLNGQSRGQNASMHTDCAHDSPDDLSILVYIGEDTDGDLVLYDKADTQRELQRIAFRPNRVVAFDGSIPHQAFAPTDDKFRMSMIIRGKYEVGFSDRIVERGQADARP